MAVVKDVPGGDAACQGRSISVFSSEVLFILVRVTSILDSGACYKVKSIITVDVDVDVE